MSKKSNTEKRKRAMEVKRPRKRIQRNPPVFIVDSSSMFSDPILLHHIVGFILRTMQLTHVPIAAIGDYPVSCMQCGKNREEAGVSTCSAGPHIMHQWPSSFFTPPDVPTPKSEVQ